MAPYDASNHRRSRAETFRGGLPMPELFPNARVQAVDCARGFSVQLGRNHGGTKQET